MLERLLTLDTDLFVFLNSLGSAKYDGLWLIITETKCWISFFLFLFYVIYKKIGLKQTLLVLVFIAVLIAFTDQTTNFVKNTVQRLRPCNNPDIKDSIRVVQVRSSFSYFSGHAANTMATATFLILLLRNKLKFIGLLVLWPFVFAYSRIYLGLHYPLDIVSGYVCGAIFGALLYHLYKKAKNTWSFMD